jgi:peptidoglycan/xylan/chitin deacetylase (PgdA/CDA1 family)
MLPDVRRSLHVLVAATLYYSGVLAFLRFFRRRLLHENGTYVLGFHRVLPESEKRRSNSLPGMILSEAVFVKLVDYLRKRMQFVTLEDFLKDEAGSGGSGKQRCLITFDDAWIDTCTRAVPLLKQKKAPAVVFVPTGLVGKQEGFWVEQLIGEWKDPSSRARLAPLIDRVPFPKAGDGAIEEVVQWLLHMSTQERQSALGDALPTGSQNGHGSVDAIMNWEQLAQVRDEGFEIGGHTVTHPLLTYEDDETVNRELCLGKQALEQKLGASVLAFAYPNGDMDRRVRERVIEAGYACAFTTEPRCHRENGDKFEIPRFLLHDGNVTGLRGEFSPAMLNLTLAGWA